MKIYTKTGDKGMTSLANGHRVSKTDQRLESYGTADELNSYVGMLRSKVGQEEQERLEWIQNKLFNLGALLAAAKGDDWITESDAHLLEKWMDEMQEGQEPLKAFVLPGGSESVSWCHICRTVTRRLERNMVGLQQEVEQNDGNLTLALQFVNRLSDFWFVLALNIAKNEEISLFLWKK